ncbi:MAG: hypothetical protein Q9227_008917 [Pyrenula ochraceoflavens]
MAASYRMLPITNYITPSLGYGVLQTVRHFAPNYEIIERISRNKGAPPFTRLKQNITTEFDYTEFDRCDVLQRSGFRLCLKNKTWDIFRKISNFTVGGQREPALKKLANVFEITSAIAPEVDIEVKNGKIRWELHDTQTKYNFEQRQKAEGRTAYASMPTRNEYGYPICCGLEPTIQLKIHTERILADEGLALIIENNQFGVLVGKIEMRESFTKLLDAVKLGNEFEKKIEVFADRHPWIFDSHGDIGESLEAFWRSGKVPSKENPEFKNLIPMFDHAD